MNIEAILTIVFIALAIITTLAVSIVAVATFIADALPVVILWTVDGCRRAWKRMFD